MLFEDLLEQIGGDWGSTAFYDEASGKYVKIMLTYDYDFTYEIYPAAGALFDSELFEIATDHEPLARGHRDPFDITGEEPEPEALIAALEEQLAGVLREAKAL